MLDGRPVAIYGPNGAGKTNILEAVSLLSPGRGLRRAAAEEMVRRPEALGWKVFADVSRRTGRCIEIETWAEAGPGAQRRRSTARPRRRLCWPPCRAVLWLVPAMDRLWIEGAEGRRRFLDRATLSFEPSHAEATLRYEKAMRERNRLLKDMVRDAALVCGAGGADGRGGRGGAGEPPDGHRGPAWRRRRMRRPPFPPPTWRWSKVARMRRVRTRCARLSPTGARATWRRGARWRGRIAAIWTRSLRTRGCAARECSTGEQKALLICLILANARALAEDGAPPVLLLDEVAAHLDAGRRAALYDEVCALGAQAWMTGTEIQLFEALGGRAQYLAVTKVRMGLS